jgi:hypothetical protein
MIPHDVRTISLLALIPSLFFVRHWVGHIERGPTGLALTAFFVVLGALPIASRIVRHFRSRQATKGTAEDGPYRTAPKVAAPTLPPTSSAPSAHSPRPALADLVCVVLALAVWAELRSAEPLQRIPPLRTNEKQCVVAPC